MAPVLAKQQVVPRPPETVITLFSFNKDRVVWGQLWKRSSALSTASKSWANSDSSERLAEGKTQNLISKRALNDSNQLKSAPAQKLLLIASQSLRLRHVAGNFQGEKKRRRSMSATKRFERCCFEPRLLLQARRKTHTECWSKSVAKTWKLQLLTTATNGSNQRGLGLERDAAAAWAGAEAGGRCTIARQGGEVVPAR